MNIEKNDAILVTGATGFLGSNVMKQLEKQGYQQIIGLSSKDYDLREQTEVRKMFQEHKPAVVINLAAYVGGILADKKYPAKFFDDNILFGTLVFQEAYKSKVKKLICCMCGCSYPAKAPNPISEKDLWNGFPQVESAPYSIAKKNLAIQSWAYRKQYGFNSIVLLPGNMYGPYDNFSIEDSHVIPGLIRKFYDAKKEQKKEVVVWGSGKPIRDFVYVEDVAEALIGAMEHYNESDFINISSGVGITIKSLIEKISKLMEFDGKIVWDTSKPDGQIEKLFDVTLMKERLHFTPKTSLDDGLQKTKIWFEQNYHHARL